jgi:hypothetical protein
MAMKYVMLRLDGGELLPLLFPEFMQHSHMAQAVPATVVSAGHVYLENGKISSPVARQARWKSPRATKIAALSRRTLTGRMSSSRSYSSRVYQQAHAATGIACSF